MSQVQETHGLLAKWKSLSDGARFGIGLNALGAFFVLVCFTFSGLFFPILGEVRFLGSRQATNDASLVFFFLSLAFPLMGVKVRGNPIRWEGIIFILVQYMVAFFYLLYEFRDLMGGGFCLVSAGS